MKSSIVKWLIGIVGSAIAGLVTTWLMGFLNPHLPSPQRAELALSNLLSAAAPRPEEGFRIVLCWLEGDDKGIDTGHVEDAFSNVKGVKLLRSARIVRGSGSWDDWSKDMKQGARTVLEEWHGDLAIVGGVRESGKVLNLWLVPRSGEGTLGRGDRPYILKNVTLDKDFHQDFGVELVIVALVAVAPHAHTGLRGEALEEGLNGATTKLSKLLEVHTVPSEHRAALEAELGAALLVLGKREGDRKRLEGAVEAFDSALKELDREGVPVGWALTQNLRGEALLRLGKGDAGLEHLEKAVGAFDAALEEFSREHTPFEWAATKSNLGSALAALGEREGNLEDLNDAVNALREAREVFAHWSMSVELGVTQSSLGGALWSLGRREKDSDHLEEAVEVLGKALDELTPERAPIPWGRTQMRLGNALATLGVREKGTGRLTDAVEAYHKALEQLTRERVPLDWGATKVNLGNTLVVLGDREGGTDSLEQAVKALRDALEELTRERVPPLHWVRIQALLGDALAMLGDRESGTKHLQEAVDAYVKALEVLVADGPLETREIVENKLNTVLVEMYKRLPVPESTEDVD